MLSNQLRGRALRIDPRDPVKTANIWHLACLHDSGVDGRQLDLSILERRFQSFAGLRLDGAVIETGLERLGLGADGPAGADFQLLNGRTCRLATERDDLPVMWRNALFRGGPTVERLYEDVFLPAKRISIHPLFQRLIRVAPGWFEQWRRWMLVRRTHRVATAVLDSMADWGLLQTERETLSLSVRVTGDEVTVRLRGAALRDEHLFTRSLAEMFQPLWGPRYLLIGKSGSYAVPSILGENRRRAETLLRHWRNHVERARLIFTQHDEGRLMLIRMIQTSLASRELFACRTRSRYGSAPGASEQ